MILMEEVSAKDVGAFWERHFRYLVEDGIISDDEDKANFQSAEYRDAIQMHMTRSRDKHHLAYFVKDGQRIGAASYCTYPSEGGKCFVLDFWVFPQFRNGGAGHSCFRALMECAAKDGARYYEINCDGRDDRMRFWKSLGFVENGVDEDGLGLLIKR